MRYIGHAGGRGDKLERGKFPAPVGGWNARDSLTDMDEDDAIVLDNMIPTTNGVSLRGGYISHATGLGDAVETIMEYAPSSGSNEMFGAAGTSVFDVTVAGAVGAAIITATGNARWSYTMHGTTAGHFLVMCNGSYGVALYNGTSWTTATFTGGVVEEDLVFVAAHQRRLYFIEKDSTSIWYLPVYAVTGVEATEVDLAPLMKEGGKLVAIGTWTRDGGDGPDDLIVFFTSGGEAIIYAGTDPASVSTWRLVGVFEIAFPVGDRPVIRSGAGLGVITAQGVVAMEQVLPASVSVTRRLAITDKISGAFTKAYELWRGNSGWEIIEYDRGQYIIVNVPDNEGPKQYVFSTSSQAWCRFTGVLARTWGTLGANIYFGDDDGTVWAFDDPGFADDDEVINYDVMSAFKDFKSPDEKTFRLARPMFTAPATVRPVVEIRVDYDTSQINATIPVTELLGTNWDEGIWDEASWGDAPVASYGWETVDDIGFVGAYRFAGSIEGAGIILAHTDIRFEIGSAL